jgi:serine/threonine protein kinase
MEEGEDDEVLVLLGGEEQEEEREGGMPSPLLSRSVTKHDSYSSSGTCSSSISIVPPEVLRCSNQTRRLKKLGCGSTCCVYLALELQSLQLLALKEVPLSGRSGGAHRENVRKEVRALKHQQQEEIECTGNSAFFGASSSCPYIVGYYGSADVEEMGVALIAMEYCGGGSCQQWLDAGHAAPEPWIAHVAWQCLKALLTLHGWASPSWLHHDIKPASTIDDQSSCLAAL